MSIKNLHPLPSCVPPDLAFTTLSAIKNAPFKSIQIYIKKIHICLFCPYLILCVLIIGRTAAHLVFHITL